MEDINDDNDNKKRIKHPLSDDTLDELEMEAEKFKETQNLGEKISIHSKLNETIKDLEKEIDDMINIIDKINIDAVNKEINDNIHESSGTTINDDIVSLEKMMENLNDEEVLQMKVFHYKRITDIVKKCKSICESDSGTLNIAKCN